MAARCYLPDFLVPHALPVAADEDVAELGVCSGAWLRMFGPVEPQMLYLGGACSGTVMFASVNPAIDDDDALQLAGLLLDQARGPDAADKLFEFVRSEPVKPHVEPWTQGYALARKWAETAELEATNSPIDVEQQLKSYGIAVKNVDLSDPSIGAVALASERKAPVVAVNTGNPRNQYPAGRRFTLAHELCHLLYDRRRGVELQIASGEWAPVEVEMRANAFAAAILMPDTLIAASAKATKVHLPSIHQPGLLAMAKRMNVSTDALIHHLVNRRLIPPVFMDGLPLFPDGD